MDDHEALAGLRQATTAMAATVRDADPGALVPACPGWDVTSLTDHLGRVHLWATIATRTSQPPETFPSRDTSQPLERWYADAAATLAATLDEVPADQVGWTVSPRSIDQRAGYWRRRQFHETTVHHVDALQATGHLPVEGVMESVPALTEEQAADGIAEVLEVMMPRTLGRTGAQAKTVLPVPVAIRCDDVDAAWTAKAVGDELVIDAGVSPESAAEISGPAKHLYLALWGRADVRLLTVEGDRAAAAALLGASLTP